jgi:hypothetical protein
MRVGVTGDHQLGRRTLEAEVETCRLAAIDRVFNHLYARIAATCLDSGRHRRIARAIVEHKHVKLGVVGRERRLDAGPDHLLFVVGGDKHRQRGPPLRRCLLDVVPLIEEAEDESTRDPDGSSDRRI